MIVSEWKVEGELGFGGLFEMDIFFDLASDRAGFIP
jgi:hypothetical protein